MVSYIEEMSMDELEKEIEKTTTLLFEVSPYKDIRSFSIRYFSERLDRLRKELNSRILVTRW